MFLGIIIIIVGVALLLQNLEILSVKAWEIIWPSLIIILGVGLVVKQKKHKGFWKAEERRGKTEEK